MQGETPSVEGRGSLGPPVDTAERDVRRKCRFARGRGRTGVAPFFFSPAWEQLRGNWSEFKFVPVAQNNNNNFDYSSIELKLVRISI